MKIRAPLLWVLVLGCVVAVSVGSWLATGRSRAVALAAATTTPRPDERYGYRSAAFQQFVQDSFRELHAGDPERFYRWMDEQWPRRASAFPGTRAKNFEELIAEQKRLLESERDPRRRTEATLELCQRLHRCVKTTMPRFSLDRGFEFVNSVQRGERQCFLQSVLIAGLLQRMGVDVGVVMVYRNIKGVPTNNGHAVPLVKLPDGTDTLCDASDPTPFVTHLGLFVRLGDYRFVAPVYKPGGTVIVRYRPEGSKQDLPTARVRTLDTAFLRSQFYYYRGERVVDGTLAKKPSRAALEQSAKYLRESVRLCPQNPLAVYMLARAYVQQGRAAQARPIAQNACELYQKFGWMPNAPREQLGRLSRRG